MSGCRGWRLAMLFAACAMVAEARRVELTWQATVPGAQHSMYRANGPCAPSSAFNRVAIAIPGTAYTDPDVPTGTYCYYVTTMEAGIESEPSNKVEVVVPPAPPSGLTAVVPAVATVRPGGVVQFVADAPVTRWTVTPQIGTISPSGLYLAPSRVQGNNVRVRVEATDGQASATAQLTVRK